MGFDPNEPRNKKGEWSKGGAGWDRLKNAASSGHNSGGGNRVIANQIKKQHAVIAGKTYQSIEGPRGKYGITTHNPDEFIQAKGQQRTLHTVHKDGEYLGAYGRLSSIKRAIQKGTLGGPGEMEKHMFKRSKEGNLTDNEKSYIKKYYPKGLRGPVGGK